jgi:hypothetical protein
MDSRFRIQDSGFRIQDSGFRAPFHSYVGHGVMGPPQLREAQPAPCPTEGQALRRASCIFHLASYILHPTSCILHPASCILHLASCSCILYLVSSDSFLAHYVERKAG